MLLVLLTNYLNDIKKIYSKSLPQNIEYVFKEETIKPNVYTAIYDLKNDNDSKEIDENYAFEIKKNGQDELEQILDSQPENVVWKELKKIFIKNEHKIKLWCKNQRTGNIYGEYYDEFKQEHKSYFDFVIKFEDGKYLYLEVKGSGDNDININKTNMLKTLYRDYFNNNQLFARNLVICVIEVDRENIKQTPFYYTNQFNDKLENFSFEELVRKLLI